MKAVIIAAGCGSRIKNAHKQSHKTLIRINGKRIIDDIIEKLIDCKINDIVIITGYKNKELEQAIKNSTYQNVKLQFINNPEWKKSNGISVYCAKESISENEEFVLLMSDHIFEKDILQNIIKTKIKKSQGLLAIDFKIDQIPDLDDGMKIQCEPTNDPFHKIIKFNKKLKNYQAIDSGIFKFNYSFFNYLEKAFSLEKYSLSDACNLIAKNNNMIGMDIKTNLWLDIDTPEMFNFKKIINKIIFSE